MSGVRLGGVPLHPAVVHFPVALWTAALLTDGAFFITRQPLCWSLTYWLLAAGALFGLLAMTLGFVDFMTLDPAHPAIDKVQTHMMVMGSSWSVFLLDLLLRSHAAPANVQWWLPGITLAGFILLAIGGHLGGRLVYHHSIGVEK